CVDGHNCYHISHRIELRKNALVKKAPFQGTQGPSFCSVAMMGHLNLSRRHSHLMPKTKAKIVAETYPCVARWLEAHGTVEFGYCPHTRSFVRALDEGGMIWSGRRSYRSFDAALADCEAGIGR